MVEYFDPESDFKPRRRVDLAARAAKIQKRKEWAAGLELEEAQRRAKEAALRLLDRCDRSVGECRAKLLEKGFSPEAVEAALARLVEVNLLNDLRYAQMLARTRNAERGLVGQALRQELSRKKLSAEIISQVMGELDGETIYEAAQGLVEKKMRSMRALPRDVKYRRLLGMLARKGYSGAVASQVINAALQAETEEFDYDFDADI
ncbi:regulatory protein RecX [Gleimia coleocanis DSM 15436]|uniref:Regulatory protein RecX n=1 Tax=Gleimia coleocanis DSM 15436 TaxID=525245 RepID=C0W0E4_9ACTO|nr:regulatory protein RecX [Gleimia coleocanis]EEH64003.1 regulatory protein RecX [Gleimia coleocanis DSM 15436]